MDVSNMISVIFGNKYILADVCHTDRVCVLVVEVCAGNNVLVVVNGIRDVKGLLVRLEVDADIVGRGVNPVLAVIRSFSCILTIGDGNRHALGVSLSRSLSLHISSSLGCFAFFDLIIETALQNGIRLRSGQALVHTIEAFVEGVGELDTTLELLDLHDQPAKTGLTET